MPCAGDPHLSGRAHGSRAFDPNCKGLSNGAAESRGTVSQVETVRVTNASPSSELPTTLGGTPQGRSDWPPRFSPPERGGCAGRLEGVHRGNGGGKPRRSRHGGAKPEHRAGPVRAGRWRSVGDLDAPVADRPPRVTRDGVRLTRSRATRTTSLGARAAPRACNGWLVIIFVTRCPRARTWCGSALWHIRTVGKTTAGCFARHGWPPSRALGC